MYIQYIFSQIYQPETPKGLIDFYNLKYGNDDENVIYRKSQKYFLLIKLQRLNNNNSHQFI